MEIERTERELRLHTPTAAFSWDFSWDRGTTWVQVFDRHGERLRRRQTGGGLAVSQLLGGEPKTLYEEHEGVAALHAAAAHNEAQEAELAAIAAAAEKVREAEALVVPLRAERDALIAHALAQHMAAGRIARAAGLSQPMVDKIGRR